MRNRKFCILIMCVLMVFTAIPGFCEDVGAKLNMKAVYLKWIEVLGVIFLILLIWEFVEWFLKRRMKLGMSETSDTVSVIKEEHEDDPFKVILREETAVVSASSQDKEKERVTRELKDSKDAYLEKPEEYKPALSDEELVARDDRKDKPRKVVVVDIPSKESQEVLITHPIPQEQAVAQKKAMVSDEALITEEGWRELMQRASLENEETIKKSGHEESKVITTTPVSTPVSEIDEEDPWKALLRKSKQEEGGVWEEDKPWSVFLKNNKGKQSEKPMEEEAAKGAPNTKAGDSNEPVLSGLMQRDVAEAPAEEHRFSGGEIFLGLQSEGEQKKEELETDLTEESVKEQKDKVGKSKPLDGADKVEEAMHTVEMEKVGRGKSPKKTVEQPTPEPSKVRKKRSISLFKEEADSSKDLKADIQREKNREKEKAIELDIVKKKEDETPEKKLPLKKEKVQSPFVPKASKVISLSSEERDDKKEMISQQETSIEAKKDRKLLGLDGTLKDE